MHRIASAQPYPYSFEPLRTALLVIDMQRDFLEPGGFGAMLGNDVSRLQCIVPTVRRLLEAARRVGLYVVHTCEAHRPDLSDCPPAKRDRGTSALRIGDAGPMGRILIAGEPGNAIVPELAPLPGETVLHKPGKGAFWATDLQTLLDARGITHLLLAGVTTEVCVQTTLREANDRGYECLLVEDATASYFPAFKTATLAMLRAQGGIVGWTATCAQVEATLGETQPSPALPDTLCLPRGLREAPEGLRWEPLRPGVEAAWLYRDPASGAQAAYLRYAPGAAVPRHRHAGHEHILVLEGMQEDEQGVYPAGSLVIQPPGSVHSVGSPDGCLVLAIWQRPVEFAGTGEEEA